MHTYKSQTLASTNVDSQGEKLTKEFLESALKLMGSARFPLHQHHDMSLPVLGFVEKPRVLPDPDHPGEWKLVGDVTVEPDDLEEALGGFSISATELIIESDEPVALIYLPFPHYNNTELVEALAENGYVSVGKWIKKAADPSIWMIIGSAVVLLVTPVWDDIYKQKIAPKLGEIINRCLHRTQAEGLFTELLQVVELNGSRVEVRLIPAKHKQAYCLRAEAIEQGMAAAIDFLSRDQKTLSVGVNRLIVYFDDTADRYKLHRAEYLDGDVIHYA